MKEKPIKILKSPVNLFNETLYIKTIDFRENQSILYYLETETGEGFIIEKFQYLETFSAKYFRLSSGSEKNITFIPDHFTEFTLPFYINDSVYCVTYYTSIYEIIEKIERGRVQIIQYVIKNPYDSIIGITYEVDNRYYRTRLENVFLNELEAKKRLLELKLQKL